MLKSVRKDPTHGRKFQELSTKSQSQLKVSRKARTTSSGSRLKTFMELVNHWKVRKSQPRILLVICFVANCVYFIFVVCEFFEKLSFNLVAGELVS